MSPDQQPVRLRIKKAPLFRQRFLTRPTKTSENGARAGLSKHLPFHVGNVVPLDDFQVQCQSARAVSASHTNFSIAVLTIFGRFSIGVQVQFFCLGSVLLRALAPFAECTGGEMKPCWFIAKRAEMVVFFQGRRLVGLFSTS